MTLLFAPYLIECGVLGIVYLRMGSPQPSNG